MHCYELKNKFNTHVFIHQIKISPMNYTRLLTYTIVNIKIFIEFWKQISRHSQVKIQYYSTTWQVNNNESRLSWLKNKMSWYARVQVVKYIFSLKIIYKCILICCDTFIIMLYVPIYFISFHQYHLR